MKKIDYEHKDFKAKCKPKQDYIKSRQDKPITELEFVGAMQMMPKHIHWSRGHSPSSAKHEYHNLKSKFGLFGGKS